MRAISKSGDVQPRILYSHQGMAQNSPWLSVLQGTCAPPIPAQSVPGGAEASMGSLAGRGSFSMTALGVGSPERSSPLPSGKLLSLE